MGRGKTLTMPERAQVDLMVQLNMSISLMSARIHCSRTLNDCYMSDHVAYGTSKSTGRARKLKQRDERNVARAVSNTMKTAKDVDLETSRAKSCSQSLQQHSSLLGFEENQSARLASVLAEPESNRKSLGFLTRSVYKNGKQYNSISELKDAVKTEWSKIHPSYLENLSNSMPNRIFQVIQKNGGFTG
uniref:HTH_Tnp_Tc3_1 domain-containing protein n=1 Tax=Caenorhabditis japonica TaxID=281687 RepID=A0A8R1E4U4_CAEJA